MMFRFFLPDFEFELDEWQQHLISGEATLAEVLQALLDHIQPIVQPELFAEFSSEAVDPEGQEIDGEEVPLALVAYLTRVTALNTRLDQMDNRLNRIEKGLPALRSTGVRGHPLKKRTISPKSHGSGFAPNPYNEVQRAAMLTELIFPSCQAAKGL